MHILVCIVDWSVYQQSPNFDVLFICILCYKIQKWRFLLYYTCVQIGEMCDSNTQTQPAINHIAKSRDHSFKMVVLMVARRGWFQDKRSMNKLWLDSEDGVKRREELKNEGRDCTHETEKENNSSDYHTNHKKSVWSSEIWTAMAAIQNASWRLEKPQQMKLTDFNNSETSVCLTVPMYRGEFTFFFLCNSSESFNDKYGLLSKSSIFKKKNPWQRDVNTQSLVSLISMLTPVNVIFKGSSLIHLNVIISKIKENIFFSLHKPLNIAVEGFQKEVQIVFREMY